MKYYVAGAALLAIFAILAFMVTSNAFQIASWDHSAFLSANKPQGKILNQIMVDLTKYGREEVWIATTALLFIFGGMDGRRTSILLVIAFIILIPLGTVLKDQIDRPRPEPSSPGNLLVTEKDDPSFPSGHAVIVSAGAFVVLARFNKGRQIAVSIALLVEAFLVIYSRVYVGNHYPLDVVAGTLVGTGIASIVVGFSRHLTPVFNRFDSLRRK